MSAEAAGLIGAVIGALTGLGGGLGVQVMQSRAERKRQVASLGGRLASGSYIVSHLARRTIDDVEIAQREFISAPEFQDSILAASELGIIAPEDVAKKAQKLANAMLHSVNAMTKDTSSDDWKKLMKDVQHERTLFIRSMRASRLRLVVGVGVRAAAEVTTAAPGATT